MNPPASISEFRQYDTPRHPESTCSLMKWCVMSMGLVHWWCQESLVKLIAPMLSSKEGVGLDLMSMLSLSSRFLRHTVCCAVYNAAMYSALVEEAVTVDCFLLDNETTDSPNRATYPDRSTSCQDLLPNSCQRIQ
jgi:hypothetical protein